MSRIVAASAVGEYKFPQAERRGPRSWLPDKLTLQLEWSTGVAANVEFELLAAGMYRDAFQSIDRKLVFKAHICNGSAAIDWSGKPPKPSDANASEWELAKSIIELHLPPVLGLVPMTLFDNVYDLLFVERVPATVNEYLAARVARPWDEKDALKIASTICDVLAEMLSCVERGIKVCD